MHTELLSLLHSLRLNGMAEVIDRELELVETKGLAPSHFLKNLLLEEHRYRQERSLLYRLKRASMPWDWSLNSFPFNLQPAVSKSQISELSQLAFLDRFENIVFIGPPGTGKTGLAIGLLRHALIAGKKDDSTGPRTSWTSSTHLWPIAVPPGSSVLWAGSISSSSTSSDT